MVCLCILGMQNLMDWVLKDGYREMKILNEKASDYPFFIKSGFLRIGKTICILP